MIKVDPTSKYPSTFKINKILLNKSKETKNGPYTDREIILIDFILRIMGNCNYFHSLAKSYELVFPVEIPVEISETPSSTGDEKNSQGSNENDTNDVSGDHSSPSDRDLSEITREELEKEFGSDLSQNFANKEQQKIDVEKLYEWLIKAQWDYSIWVSEINRDHNIQTIGKIDPESETFKKIVRGLNIEFNGNTWTTIIHAHDGLYFSSSLNSNGFIRFWINEHLSLARFFKNLQDKLLPCHLEIKEFKELIETIGITENGNFDERQRLFLLLTENDREKLKEYLTLIREKGMQQLETANLIGPAHVIAQYFNKACLVCKNILYKGVYVPILIKVDKSKGPFEIEYFGPEGPTRRVQDAVARALSVANSLGEFERALEFLLEVGCANNALAAENNALLKAHDKKFENIEKGLIALQEQATSELTSTYHDLGLQQRLIEKLSNQEKAMGAHYERTSETLDDAVNGFNNAAQSFERTIRGVKEEFNTTRDHIQEKFEILRFEMDLMKTDLATKLHSIAEQNIFNHHEINKKVDDLEININSKIDAKFSDFEAIINEKFENSRSDRKENLQVILETLNEKLGPALADAVGPTIDNAIEAAGFIVRNNIIAHLISDLQEELGKSRSSIYNYLKQLWEKGLLKRIIVKSNKKGRPTTLFLPLQFIKKLKNKNKHHSGKW